MQNNIIPIIIEKEGVSDDSYTIVELYYKNGESVKKGDMILCIETSKTIIDIEAPSSGYVFYNVNEYDEVTVGKIVAAISDNKSFSHNWFAANDEAKQEKSTALSINSDVRISKPAQKLIDENNIDITVFGTKSMISKDDVYNYLNSCKKANAKDISINEESILVLGGGGHAKMCIEILKHSKSYKIVGIVDSKLPINSTVLDITVLGRDNIIDELVNSGLKYAILGIGAVLNHAVRKKLFLFLKEKRLFIPNIIHPSSSVEPSVKLGEGNQIMQGAIIGPDVKIGNNCIINTGSIVSHDAIIGNNVHIAPGAIIAGSVTIGDNTVIGMGTTVFLGVNIGENVTINNGINVFSNVLNNENIKYNKST